MTLHLHVQDRYGPVGLVHVDAHLDVQDSMNGVKVCHGTTFRRAYEDGCLDPKRVIQIGIRGSGYGLDDHDWPKSVVSKNDALLIFFKFKTYDLFL